ncbi:MAG: hypothetical protein RI953_879 [Pseudomonadota bacterium]|jgi:hypothetical protein
MRSDVRQFRRFRLISAVLASVLVFVACSADKLPSNTKAIILPSGMKKTLAAEGTSTSGSGADTANKDQKDTSADATAAKVEPLVMNLTTNFSEGRQRKNLEQLRDAILNCVGATPTDPDILKLTDDMIIYPNSTEFQDKRRFPDNTGRERFLLPNVYVPALGKEVLEVERDFLDVGATRTGLRADSIEDDIYLKSLVTVASVAAFNCRVDDQYSNCYCADKMSAERMVARCMPQFAPTSDAYQAAVQELYSVNNCGAPGNTDDGLKKRRRAIAALLSSYSFATSR